MRILVLLFTITFLCPRFSGAQERFFHFVEGAWNNATLELNDGYLLVGIVGTGGVFDHEFRYNYLDLEGNVIDSVEFFIDTVESTSTWNTTSQLLDLVGTDTAYIASYLGKPSVDSGYGAVFRYIIPTEEFELVTTRVEGILTQFYCSKVKNDSSLLVAGVFGEQNYTVRTRLYEMDMEGNTRWQTTFYGGWPSNTRPNQILTMNNGNIALMMREYDPVNPALFVAREHAIVVMMDSVGNELWRVSPGDTANYRIWPGGMVELPNGELLVSYTDPYYYDEDGEWHFNDSNTVHLASYDVNGNLNWDVNYLYEITNGLSELGRVLYRVRQMQMLTDGNILMTGTTGYGGLMLKVEPDGNMVWFREHLKHPLGENDVISEHTHIYHTLPTSDGGFLSTGQYRSDPGNIYPAGIQTAIALKVDEYGCLEEGCGPTDAVGELDTGQGLVVYPNPTTEVLQVRSSKFKVKSLALRDVRGTILQYLEPSTLNLELNIDGLASGIYLLQAKLADGTFVNTKIIKE